MSTSGENKYHHYLWKSFKWTILNTCFGLFPLLLVGIVNILTNGKEGHHQIDHLIYEGGIILFVCSAIMGAVAVDYLLSGEKVGGIELFAIYIFPLLLTGFMALEFLLVCLQKLNKFALAYNSKKTIILVIVSLSYCILAKSSLYLKEDSERK